MRKKIMSLIAALATLVGLSVAGVGLAAPASAYGACPGAQSQVYHQRLSGSATVTANRNGSWWTVDTPSNGRCGSQVKVTAWTACTARMTWSVDGVNSSAMNLSLNTAYSIPKSHYGKATVTTSC